MKLKSRFSSKSKTLPRSWLFPCVAFPSPGKAHLPCIPGICFTYKTNISDPRPTNQPPRWPCRTPDSGGIPNTRLSSTSLARLPITCAIRRSLWLGFARFRLYLLLVILSTGSLFYARSRYRSHRATVAQIPALVDIVMDKLSAQKEIAYDDSTEDPFLFLPNLRDDVLRAMHSLAERERVWQRVRPVVEQNSNVRTGQREGRNGEVGRAWEWIGPTASLTAGGEASARRRRSGRVSFGPGVKKEEDDDEDVKTPVAEMVEKSQDRSGIHRRWEEPRPIY